jgi:hypothetical protein
VISKSFSQSLQDISYWFQSDQVTGMRVVWFVTTSFLNPDEVFQIGALDSNHQVNLAF